MTNEQFAIYIQQMKYKLQRISDQLESELEDDENYFTIEKGIMGDYKVIKILSPLSTLQSEIDDELEILQGSQS